MSLRDSLGFSSPRTVINAAYASLSANQHERPHVQVAAAAVLFKVLMEELKLDHNDLLILADQLIKADDNYYQVEVQALRAYVQGELKK